MISARPASTRGKTLLPWLDSAHTFSFGEYHDPAYMGFLSLRVINDDLIAPSSGFGMHPHRDMEIISWVLDGALQHRDSLGNGSVIKPGDIQVMSAGSGIRHSEFNPSTSESCRLLQIWILPDARGHEPRYDQRALDPASCRNRLALAAGPFDSDAVVKIHQDARMYVARLSNAAAVTHALAPGRSAYLQIARGNVTLNGSITLADGDAAEIQGENSLTITGASSAGDSEVILFDLG